MNAKQYLVEGKSGPRGTAACDGVSTPLFFGLNAAPLFQGLMCIDLYVVPQCHFIFHFTHSLLSFRCFSFLFVNKLIILYTGTPLKGTAFGPRTHSYP